MIRITISGEKAYADGPFPFNFIRVVTGLSGRKTWQGDSAVKFEATGSNLRLIKEAGLEVEWLDDGGALLKEENLAGIAKQAEGARPFPGEYKAKMELFMHQKQMIAASWDKSDYAILAEMGLGKTAVALHTAGMLYSQGLITGVLILAPKGVHRQWIEQQLPEHAIYNYDAVVWSGSSTKAQWRACNLNFFAMNIDAIRTPNGYEAAETFLRQHGKHSLMIVDESHQIKSWSALRTKAAWKLGKLAKYRRIMTGTPIAKNILDAWAQFKFLDVGILGHKYVSSFRSRYCVMGGFEQRQIIGQKNLEEFYGLIAPHSFRLTKAEALDLPPKMYIERPYDMGEKTLEHYKSIKKTFMTQLENGEIVDVANAAVALVKLQQVCCGYLPGTDGYMDHFSAERLEQMMEVVEQLTGSIVIWARFIQDILRIKSVLSEAYGPHTVVTYYGATKTPDRAAAVERFRSGDARFFVSNQATGGIGLNLQGICRDVIYYSNDFDALHRWQSEDRVHRVGMGDQPVTYYDLIANRSVDRLILKNLKAKKGISDFTLDQIRQSLEKDD